MGLSIGRVDGYFDRPNAILLIGVDNLNAVRWIVKGKPRINFPTKLIIACPMRCVKQGIEVAIFY